MICTRCGWDYDVGVDYYCSGCGKILRGLEISPNKTHYNLFCGGEASILALEIENQGEHPVLIDGWQLDGLKNLDVRIDGAIEPTVKIGENDRVSLEVKWEESQIRMAQAGKLRIFSGICPPRDLTLVCSPAPVFFFYVNNQKVRENRVRCITGTPRNPELDFRIVLGGSSDVIWTAFRLYPEGSPQTAFPLPAEVVFPAEIVQGKPFGFKVIPNVIGAIDGPTELRAEFLFEQCGPRAFTVEVVEDVRIAHTQDPILLGENAFIRGKSVPREVNVTLRNVGGISAEIRQVKSLEDWIKVDSLPAPSTLQPYSASESSFKIIVNPSRIGGSGEVTVNGRIEIKLRGREERVIVMIGAEVRNPVPLPYPLAVDFGNSGTCAASFQNHVIVLSKLEDKHHELPTIIEFGNFAPEGEPETGEGFHYGRLLYLTRYAQQNFLHRIWSFKKLVGKGVNVAMFDIRNKRLQNLSVDQIFGFYLREIVKRFERESGYCAREVVLTYPASFSNSQVQKLRDTAEDTLGLNVIAELSEPEALALYYLRNQKIEEDDLLFAVFDFGGGTTDISIGRFQNKEGVRTVTILISVGLDELGGDNLSFEIAKDIYSNAAGAGFKNFERLFPNAFNDIFYFSRSQRAELYNFMSLMEQAEALKTNENGLLDQLLANGEANLSFPGFYPRRDGPPELWITKYKVTSFRQVAEGRIRRGFERLASTLGHLTEHGVIERDVTQLGLLVLGGNSSRLPLVRELAREVMRLPDDRILFNRETAKTAVSLGAAQYGKMLEDPDIDIVFENPPCLKFPIGMERNGRFQTIFPAGSTFGSIKSIPLNLRASRPKLRLFLNPDPAETEMAQNSGIRELGAFQLKSGGEQTTLLLKLNKNGIDLPEGGGKPNFLEIEL